MLNIKKGFLISVLAIGMMGCSGPDSVDMDAAATDAGLSPDDYTVHDNGAVEVHSQVKGDDNILWYQDDLSEPVENVGMLNPNSIMSSAKLEPSETIDSTDAEGELKKIYIFNSESSIAAQFEHSANSVVLQWYMYSDESKTLENSQQSLKDVYRLARAMAGKEGADAIMYLSNGGKYRSKPVGGYPATGQCNSGLCFVNIDLS